MGPVKHSPQIANTWRGCGIICVAILAVTITFRQAEVVRCPDEPSLEERIRVVRGADGTYRRILAMLPPSDRICFTSEATWREEWTGPPEQGGVFLRRLP